MRISKNRVVKTALVAFLVCSALVANVPAAHAAQPGSVDPAVKQLLQAGKPADVWINISDVAAPSQESFTSETQTKQAIRN